MNRSFHGRIPTGLAFSTMIVMVSTLFFFGHIGGAKSKIVSTVSPQPVEASVTVLGRPGYIWDVQFGDIQNTASWTENIAGDVSSGTSVGYRDWLLVEFQCPDNTYRSERVTVCTPIGEQRPQVGDSLNCDIDAQSLRIIVVGDWHRPRQ